MPTNEPGSDGVTDPKKSYHAPTLRTHGSVNDLTLTQAAGPNFDGGGGANIYSS